MPVMEMEQSEDTYLTTTEVAKELRVSSVTVQKLLGDKKLRGTRIGKNWRIKRSDLQEYLERNTNVRQEE